MEVYDHYIDYQLSIEKNYTSYFGSRSKECFFGRFSMKWRHEFVVTKCTNFYTAMVEDIMQFMKQKKKTCNHEDKQRKKLDKNQNKHPQKEGG